MVIIPWEKWYIHYNHKKTYSYDLFLDREICHLLDVESPRKSKAPKFIKYRRAQIHLKVYYGKMAKIIYYEELMIHHFHESLTRMALKWYASLISFEMKKWEYMVDAFLKKTI